MQEMSQISDDSALCNMCTLFIMQNISKLVTIQYLPATQLI